MVLFFLIPFHCLYHLFAAVVAIFMILYMVVYLRNRGCNLVNIFYSFFCLVLSSGGREKEERVKEKMRAVIACYLFMF